MPAIERMNRYGRVWRITLDCGHVIERTPQEIKQQQLYVGKRLGCQECCNQIKRS